MSSGYIVSADESTFYITESTKIDKLPPGGYIIETDANNAMLLSSISLGDDNIIELPNRQLQKILDEVRSFWKEAKKYLKYNLPHKRGILLHGHPGSGKTTMINEVCNYMIEADGIVIFCTYFDASIRDQLIRIREIEPNRPMVIVLEQLESILISEDSLNVDLLEFLEGMYDIDHVLFLASTTDLKVIPDNIKKRPSRFDLKVEIKLPDAADREHYFNQMIPKADLAKIDIQSWIMSTNGYTISHLKELITSYFIYGYEFNEIIANINTLISTSNVSVGFK